MRILLDTHVWLWLIGAPDRLGKAGRELFTDPGNVLHFSAASAWEIAIKYALGKLPLPEPPDVFIPSRLVRDGITPLPIQLEHSLRVATLPPHHRDPFDRLLVAQAQLESLTLCTADRQLAPYDVERITVGPKAP